jgi:hypothetical protein
MFPYEEVSKKKNMIFDIDSPYVMKDEGTMNYKMARLALLNRLLYIPTNPTSLPSANMGTDAIGAPPKSPTLRDQYSKEDITKILGAIDSHPETKEDELSRLFTNIEEEFHIKGSGKKNPKGLDEYFERREFNFETPPPEIIEPGTPGVLSSGPVIHTSDGNGDAVAGVNWNANVTGIIEQIHGLPNYDIVEYDIDDFDPIDDFVPGLPSTTENRSTSPMPHLTREQSPNTSKKFEMPGKGEEKKSQLNTLKDLFIEKGIPKLAETLLDVGKSAATTAATKGLSTHFDKGLETHKHNLKKEEMELGNQASLNSKRREIEFKTLADKQKHEQDVHQYKDKIGQELASYEKRRDDLKALLMTLTDPKERLEILKSLQNLK